MSSENIADQDLGSAPEVVSPDLLSLYNTSPEVLCASGPEPRLGEYQEESDLNIGLKPLKGKVWGMKRKTFRIVLGTLILLIIAVAAGVGGGLARTTVEGPKPLDSSTSTNSSPRPTSSSDHPSLTTMITPSTSSSPTPTPIRNNTPLAAVNWNASNLNTQLFYKHTDGSIRLQEKGGFEWGEQSPQITKPKDDSGLAAIGWLEDGVRQVRVYTAGGDNALVESVWNSSGNLWYDQDISTGKEIAPLAAGSHLTAYTWFENGLQQIRVYYQGQDGYIREAAHNSTNAGIWWKGAAPTIQDFPRAKSGTGLAIVSFPDTDKREAKLYYQSMEGKLVSYDYKPAATFTQSWQNQNASVDHGSIPDGTHLTAVVNTSGVMTLRIYFIRDGKLVEIWWSQKGGWQSWNMHDAAAPGVAAVSYSDDIHVFFQNKTEYLSTLGLNRNVNKWQFTGII